MWKVNGSFHLLHVLMTILGLSRIPDIERCHKLLTNTDFGGSTCFQGITLYQTLIFSELQLVCQNQGQMLIGKAVTVRVKRGLCLNNFVEKKKTLQSTDRLAGDKEEKASAPAFKFWRLWLEILRSTAKTASTVLRNWTRTDRKSRFFRVWDVLVQCISNKIKSCPPSTKIFFDETSDLALKTSCKNDKSGNFT